MRIQKYLSEQGILSRRKTEEYIKKGWIRVNGDVVTQLGFKITPGRDKVELDKHVYQIKRQYKYIMFHKPRGIVTNCPSHGESEIKGVLPKNLKSLSAIGRLDKASEGLILLSNDGIFAKSILDAETPHEREYIVRTHSPLTSSDITLLEKGVDIDGYTTKPCTINMLKPTLFSIILMEGKNRQIRHMVEAVDTYVIQLKRVRFGNIQLGNLPPGGYRAFDPQAFEHKPRDKYR